MLLDVETFRRRVDFDLDGLIADLQDETRRSTASEAVAWRNSLPAFSRVLDHERLRPFHVQVGAHGTLAVEYRLPASTSWADLVLLGRDERRPSAVIVELKDWDTAGDEPGPREGLIRHAKREVLHPSDQVRGYTEYCRRFHSAVQDANARVDGCVLFTYSSAVDAYRSEPHARLVADFPVFSRCEEDLVHELPDYLAARLVRPDAEFAEHFARGRYQQDRGFVRQVSATIADPGNSPFVLLDRQRTGFEACMKQVERVLAPARANVRRRDDKAVVLVQGPPGSGKSVIAAHLWARGMTGSCG